MECADSSCNKTEGNQKSGPRKARCPANGQEYRQVAFKAMVHQLRQPWSMALPEQAYYFCSSPECDVVYFGEDGTTVSRAQLRSEVGQKSTVPDRLLCYCFDIRLSDIASSTKKGQTLRDYVIQQTASGVCACETRNPSGRCCLADFPAVDQSAKSQD